MASWDGSPSSTTARSVLRRPCLTCGTPTEGTRCPAHTRQRDNQRPSPSHRGHGYQYRKLRAIVLERDGYTCQLRRRGCLLLATTADYIVPWSKGGLLDESNLVASCLPCNVSKGVSAAS